MSDKMYQLKHGSAVALETDDLELVRECLKFNTAAHIQYTEVGIQDYEEQSLARAKSRPNAS